ncbi:MAG: EAL domain-containing protein [Proteobacteria bacterium]|nr:EAL domain-containing protein [Pseudomonadota bacterium]
MTRLYRASYPAGSSVFKQGDIDDRAYIIESGKVEISTPQGVLAVLPQSEIFGEMALLDQGARSASARALEDTSLIVIERQQIQNKIDRADPVLRYMLSLLLDRLRSTHRALSGQTFVNDPEESALERAKKIAVDDLHQHAIRRLNLEREISLAVERKEFFVVYQPIMRLTPFEISGFEALIRWKHPERGMVSPMDFIPVAEETGLIVPIGAMVLDAALGQTESWLSKKIGPNSLSMAINLSARQFFDQSDFEAVLKQVTSSGVPTNQVKLEVTESIIMDNPERVGGILGEIKQTGSLLSLDDFGTGYSSFSYLHQYPFDVLKVDRSFVSRIVGSQRNHDIVRAIVGLAHDLGMEVVAEGIEKDEEAETLRKLGCEYGQGYRFAKPLSADDATAFMQRGKPN